MATMCGEGLFIGGEMRWWERNRGDPLRNGRDDYLPWYFCGRDWGVLPSRERA